MRHCTDISEVEHVLARNGRLVPIDNLKVVGELGGGLGKVGELGQLEKPVRTDGRHLDVGLVIHHELGSGQEFLSLALPILTFGPSGGFKTAEERGKLSDRLTHTLGDERYKLATKMTAAER